MNDRTISKRRKTSVVLVVCLGLFAILSLTASSCSGDSNADHKKVNDEAKKLHPYLPQNNVEFNNYNKAQQLYDTPSTIIWCTTTWANPSSPLVTIPIAGKLTSSSTTFFRPEEEVSVGGDGSNPLGTSRSVDKMFHPNPAPYRYGFTPGDQYMDFFNLPTLCTTALTKFQREQTAVSVTADSQAKAADAAAEEALKKGDHAQAQRELQGLESAGGK